MKRWIITVVALIAVGFAGAFAARSWLLPPTANAAELDPVQGAAASRLIAHLDQAEYDAALEMFDARAREALAGGKLAEVWEVLPKQLGARTALIGPRGETLAGRPIVSFRMEFPLMALDARVSFDAAGAIDGFRIVPAQAIAAAPPPTDAQFTEREFAVAGLPGTLTLPKGSGPFPAVVLVHGSGPHDRDLSIGPNKPFRDLAHGLAARGIAVLRYVKRTQAEPQRFSGEFTIDDEAVDDAVAAVALLRSASEVDADRVFALGLSLGGYVAPRIGRAAPDLAGLIVLAGTTRPLQVVLPEQLRFLAQRDGSIDAAEQRGIDTVIAQIAALDDALARGAGALAEGAQPLLGIPLSYWRDLSAYDPVALAAELPQPLLILQGERDYQVTVAGDLARWQERFANDARATIRVYPGLNHLFIAGEGAPNPEEYFKPGRVDAQVIADIAHWIAAH
jgi:hypothetical protein